MSVDKHPLILLELVERLANLMRAEQRRLAASFPTGQGLEAIHVQVLQYLQRANRYSNTPQAIADYLRLTKGTISQTLLVLDRRGLIERFQDDIDRRVVRLRLVAAGEQLLFDSETLLPWNNATRNLSPNRVRNAVSALREALAQMQEDGEIPGFGSCSACTHFKRLNQRVYQCSLKGERLSLPDTRRICRLFIAKGGRA